jgi:hypothetical protein
VERVDAMVDTPLRPLHRHMPIMVFPLTSDDVLSRRSNGRAGIFMYGVVVAELQPIAWRIDAISAR